MEITDLRSRAQESLEAIHSAGLLHGNPSVQNMCLKDGTVYFTGLSYSMPCDDPESFQEEMVGMLDQIEELEVRNNETTPSPPATPTPQADGNLIKSHPREGAQKQIYSQHTL